MDSEITTIIHNLGQQSHKMPVISGYWVIRNNNTEAVALSLTQV